MGNFGLGIIEINNWYNAGEQLSKALRDFYMYGSTAVGRRSQTLLKKADRELAL
jgi:hypothetical protein